VQGKDKELKTKNWLTPGLSYLSHRCNSKKISLPLSKNFKSVIQLLNYSVTQLFSYSIINYSDGKTGRSIF
jgi:hypothetical protein